MKIETALVTVESQLARIGHAILHAKRGTRGALPDARLTTENIERGSTMTFRKSILAAVVASLALPVIASASGLTRADIEAGQVYLLSQRKATHTTAQVAKVAPRPETRASDVTSPEHKERMDSGLVRMTTGAMEGAKN